MMRSIKFLPALALGLALSAPMAQSQTMPSLQFPETGTFCGLLTLCDTVAHAKDARTPGVALLPETHDRTQTVIQPKSDILVKPAAPKKAKH
ncbi:MAG: hypothetical protein ACSHWS_09290 [Sulfitobacter sp.]